MDLLLKFWHSEAVIPRAVRSAVYAFLGYVALKTLDGTTGGDLNETVDAAVGSLDNGLVYAIATFLVASGATKLRLGSKPAE